VKKDTYGEGPLIEDLEKRVVELLGKPAAVFMPSGTMAQRIALRVWCDRAGVRTVAFHPKCHLQLHEEMAYDRLHGLTARLVGDPSDLVRLTDLEGVQERLVVLLLELPQREIGGRLSEWDELTAQAQWAREHDVRLHLDGARLRVLLQGPRRNRRLLPRRSRRRHRRGACVAGAARRPAVRALPVPARGPARTGHQTAADIGIQPNPRPRVLSKTSADGRVVKMAVTAPAAPSSDRE